MKLFDKNTNFKYEFIENLGGDNGLFITLVLKVIQ